MHTLTPVGVSVSSAAPDCLVLMIHSMHAMSICRAMGRAPRTNAVLREVSFSQVVLAVVNGYCPIRGGAVVIDCSG